MMQEEQLVVRLKELLAHSHINHEEELFRMSTLKEAHIYCALHKLSAQQYGPLLEKFIVSRYNFKKNRSQDCIGDCSKESENVEIKVSLGGKSRKKFNYVQIRVSQDVAYYILTSYHLTEENAVRGGELYIFKIPGAKIKKIISSFGGYAHGTLKEHGNITLEKLEDPTNTKEYAVRPVFNNACWKALLQYRILESDI
jgi:hypothetical protein